jgi:hypothetical protein
LSFNRQAPHVWPDSAARKGAPAQGGIAPGGRHEFPARKEFAGNFFALRKISTENARDSKSLRRNPCAAEQGIFCAQQGII